MGLFYSATEKEIYAVRRKIFTDKGIQLLSQNGFEQSPFSGACFGRYDNRLHTYDFCRLRDNSILQQVTVHISRGDKWIQISLNIFQLDKTINSLQQMKNVDGMKFYLPPNSISNMRLHVDDFKGMPLFNYDFMFREHKLKCFWTKSGFKKSVKRLEQRIVSDLTNFEKYVSRWHKLFKPLKTTIEGDIIGLKEMTIEEKLETTRLTKRFNEVKHKNKDEATKILKWLEVDELTTKSILNYTEKE